MTAARLRIACVLLATWSAFGAVPTPQSYFGHEIGADKTVLDWDKVVGYFQEKQPSTGFHMARSTAHLRESPYLWLGSICERFRN